MHRLGHEFRRRLFGFLILWMTVVGLGVSVSHCHAANDSVQSHCLGWGCAGVPDAVPCGDTSTETHSHLILLGFEMPGEHVPGPTLPAGVMQLESATSSAIIETDWSDVAWVDQAILPATIKLELCSLSKQSPIQIPHVKNHLCHFASRLLAGVLVS